MWVLGKATLWRYYFPLSHSLTEKSIGTYYFKKFLIVRFYSSVPQTFEVSMKGKLATWPSQELKKKYLNFTFDSNLSVLGSWKKNCIRYGNCSNPIYFFSFLVSYPFNFISIFHFNYMTKSVSRDTLDKIMEK